MKQWRVKRSVPHSPIVGLKSIHNTNFFLGQIPEPPPPMEGTSHTYPSAFGALPHTFTLLKCSTCSLQAALHTPLLDPGSAYVKHGYRNMITYIR